MKCRLTGGAKGLLLNPKKPPKIGLAAAGLGTGRRIADEVKQGRG